MEAPNIIKKLPIILSWILESFTWFQNLKLIWTNVNSQVLFLCLARIRFCQIITIGLLELPGKIGSSNLFACQVEQMHLVWRFGKVLLPLFECFQMLLVRISNFKCMPWCKHDMKKRKNYSYFSVPIWGCYKSTPLTGISSRDSSVGRGTRETCNSYFTIFSIPRWSSLLRT